MGHGAYHIHVEATDWITTVIFIPNGGFGIQLNITATGRQGIVHHHIAVVFLIEDPHCGPGIAEFFQLAHQAVTQIHQLVQIIIYGILLAVI